MRYSIEPNDRIYVKRYRFLYLQKSMGTQLSSKYSQKPLDRTKKSTTNAIKTTSKRAIQTTAKVTDDLIGNKTADEITSFSKNPSNKL